MIDTSELTQNITVLAEQQGLSELEVITLLQTGAAASGEEELLDALCYLKRKYIPHTVDPYMPTDAEWAAHPDMIAAATDGDGEMWLYSDTPSDAQPSPIREFAIWRCPECEESISLKWVTPPADFHTTLRYRPDGE